MNRASLHFVATGCLLAASCLVSGAASAQATRTWVSGVGDDANPCSRTAPCKTFAGAISKTAAGGEISALDPGGFGSVTITKSITLNAPGGIGGILASGGVNGIVVNAGPNDVVYVRGLSINGAGTTRGLNGISFLAGGALHVEDTAIYGFSAEGINFAPSGNSELYVSDTTLRENGEGAIYVHPGAAGTAKGTISNAQMNGNARGVRAEDGSVVLVKNSVAAGGNTAGFNVVSTSTAAVLTLEGSTSANNQTGVRSSGANAVLRLNNTTVAGNAGLGLSAAGGGSIISFGNNRVSGNAGGNGAPTSSEPSM